MIEVGGRNQPEVIMKLNYSKPYGNNDLNSLRATIVAPPYSLILPDIVANLCVFVREHP